MQPYQQRVVDEKAELDAKLWKLLTFGSTPAFAGGSHAELFSLMLEAIRQRSR